MSAAIGLGLGVVVVLLIVGVGVAVARIAYGMEYFCAPEWQRERMAPPKWPGRKRLRRAER